MVFVPSPGYTPNPGVPTVDLTPEILSQQELTHWFIMQDPTPVVLVPYSEVPTPGGGVKLSAGAPRPEQIMKLIQMAHTERPVDSTSDSANGVQRKHDFTLLGEWDATVEVNDRWDDPITGQAWRVDSIVPWNGYEVKAMLMSYGDRADHG